jgi:hypothetical protein
MQDLVFTFVVKGTIVSTNKDVILHGYICLTPQVNKIGANYIAKEFYLQISSTVDFLDPEVNLIKYFDATRTNINFQFVAENMVNNYIHVTKAKQIDSIKIQLNDKGDDAPYAYRISICDIETDGVTSIKLSMYDFKGLLIESNFSYCDFNLSIHQVPCFLEGTRLLTSHGYKAVETLTKDDRLVTTENRTTTFKLMKSRIPFTTEITAPYKIAKDALGDNMPIVPLFLSPLHKFAIRDNMWVTPKIGMQKGLDIKQCPMGQTITYYHVQCENYFRDSIIAEGVVTESFGNTQENRRTFTWNDDSGAWTRNKYNIWAR